MKIYYFNNLNPGAELMEASITDSACKRLSIKSIKCLMSVIKDTNEVLDKYDYKIWQGLIDTPIEDNDCSQLILSKFINLKDIEANFKNVKNILKINNKSLSLLKTIQINKKPKRKTKKRKRR